MSVLLQFTRFKSFNIWDVKRNLSSLIYSDYEIVTLDHYIQEEKTKIKPFESPNDDFKILGVSNKIGLFDNEIKKGKEINQAYKVVKDGFLAFNPYRINVGSIGLKTNKQKNDLISPAYVVFSCNEKLLPEYLFLVFKTNTFNEIIKANTKGSVRQILSYDILESLKIPLPPLEVQKEIVESYYKKLDLANKQLKEIEEKEKEIEEYLYKELGIEILNEEQLPLLNFISFKKLNSWSYKDIMGSFQLISSKYKTIRLNQNSFLYEDIFRGKSPKYDNFSTSKILNQKCIRWNQLELKHSKTVKKDWLDKIDKKFFTKENDILINSTGDGTIGRATCITEEHQNLLYDSHILLVRLKMKEINSLFLTYFLNSTLGQKQIEHMKSAVATKQTELGINNFKNIQFILPPLSIQNKIANHILNIKADIQKLKQQSIKNKTLALSEFENKVFNEA